MDLVPPALVQQDKTGLSTNVSSEFDATSSLDTKPNEIGSHSPETSVSKKEDTISISSNHISSQPSLSTVVILVNVEETTHKTVNVRTQSSSSVSSQKSPQIFTVLNHQKPLHQSHEHNSAETTMSSSEERVTIVSKDTENNGDKDIDNIGKQLGETSQQHKTSRNNDKKETKLQFISDVSLEKNSTEIFDITNVKIASRESNNVNDRKVNLEASKERRAAFIILNNYINRGGAHSQIEKKSYWLKPTDTQDVNSDELVLFLPVINGKNLSLSAIEAVSSQLSNNGEPLELTFSHLTDNVKGYVTNLEKNDTAFFIEKLTELMNVQSNNFEIKNNVFSIRQEDDSVESFTERSNEDIRDHMEHNQHVRVDELHNNESLKAVIHFDGNETGENGNHAFLNMFPVHQTDRSVESSVDQLNDNIHENIDTSNEIREIFVGSTLTAEDLQNVNLEQYLSSEQFKDPESDRHSPESSLGIQNSGSLKAELNFAGNETGENINGELLFNAFTVHQTDGSVESSIDLSTDEIHEHIYTPSEIKETLVEALVTGEGIQNVNFRQYFSSEQSKEEESDRHSVESFVEIQNNDSLEAVVHFIGNTTGEAGNDVLLVSAFDAHHTDHSGERFFDLSKEYLHKKIKISIESGEIFQQNQTLKVDNFGSGSVLIGEDVQNAIVQQDVSSEESDMHSITRNHVNPDQNQNGESLEVVLNFSGNETRASNFSIISSAEHKSKENKNSHETSDEKHSVIINNDPVISTYTQLSIKKLKSQLFDFIPAEQFSDTQQLSSIVVDDNKFSTELIENNFNNITAEPFGGVALPTVDDSHFNRNSMSHVNEANNENITKHDPAANNFQVHLENDQENENAKFVVNEGYNYDGNILNLSPALLNTGGSHLDTSNNIEAHSLNIGEDVKPTNYQIPTKFSDSSDLLNPDLIQLIDTHTLPAANETGEQFTIELNIGEVVKPTNDQMSTKISNSSNLLIPNIVQLSDAHSLPADQTTPKEMNELDISPQVSTSSSSRIELDDHFLSQDIISDPLPTQVEDYIDISSPSEHFLLNVREPIRSDANPTTDIIELFPDIIDLSTSPDDEPIQIVPLISNTIIPDIAEIDPLGHGTFGITDTVKVTEPINSRADNKEKQLHDSTKLSNSNENTATIIANEAAAVPDTSKTENQISTVGLFNKINTQIPETLVDTKEPAIRTMDNEILVINITPIDLANDQFHDNLIINNQNSEFEYSTIRNDLEGIGAVENNITTINSAETLPQTENTFSPDFVADVTDSFLINLNSNPIIPSDHQQSEINLDEENLTLNTEKPIDNFDTKRDELNFHRELAKSHLNLLGNLDEPPQQIKNVPSVDPTIVVVGNEIFLGRTLPFRHEQSKKLESLIPAQSNISTIKLTSTDRTVQHHVIHDGKKINEKSISSLTENNQKKNNNAVFSSDDSVLIEKKKNDSIIISADETPEQLNLTPSNGNNNGEILHLEPIFTQMLEAADAKVTASMQSREVQNNFTDKISAMNQESVSLNTFSDMVVDILGEFVNNSQCNKNIKVEFFAEPQIEVHSEVQNQSIIIEPISGIDNSEIRNGPISSAEGITDLDHGVEENNGSFVQTDINLSMKNLDITKAKHLKTTSFVTVTSSTQVSAPNLKIDFFTPIVDNEERPLPTTGSVTLQSDSLAQIKPTQISHGSRFHINSPTSQQKIVVHNNLPALQLTQTATGREVIFVTGNGEKNDLSQTSSVTKLNGDEERSHASTIIEPKLTKQVLKISNTNENQTKRPILANNEFHLQNLDLLRSSHILHLSQLLQQRTKHQQQNQEKELHQHSRNFGNSHNIEPLITPTTLTRAKHFFKDYTKDVTLAETMPVFHKSTQKIIPQLSVKEPVHRLEQTNVKLILANDKPRTEVNKLPRTEVNNLPRTEVNNFNGVTRTAQFLFLPKSFLDEIFKKTENFSGARILRVNKAKSLLQK